MMNLSIQGVASPGQPAEKGVPGWKVNQELAGTVKTTAQGKAVLLIGGRAWSVVNNALLKPGENFLFKVMSLTPVPHLKIIGPGAAETQGTVALSPLAASAAATRPESLPGLLALMSSLATAYPNALPPQTLALLEKFAARTFAQGQQLDGQMLKKGIRDSGLFLESKLAQLADRDVLLKELQGDAKAMLLQLLDSFPRRQPRREQPGSRQNRDGRTEAVSVDEDVSDLHPAPGATAGMQRAAEYRAEQYTAGGDPRAEEIASLCSYRLEDVLENLIRRQAETAADIGAGRYCWHLELPLVWGGQALSVPMTISRRPADDHLSGRDEVAFKDSGAETWRVEFSLDLARTGHTLVCLEIRDRKVGVHITPEQQTTLSALDAGRQRLEDYLSGGRLELDAFTCQSGGLDNG